MEVAEFSKTCWASESLWAFRLTFGLRRPLRDVLDYSCAEMEKYPISVYSWQHCKICTYLWQLCRRIHRNVANVTRKFDYDSIRFIVLYHLRLFRSFSVARSGIDSVSNFCYILFLVSVFDYRIGVTFWLFCLIWTKIIATWFARFTARWRAGMLRTFIILFLRFFWGM